MSVITLNRLTLPLSVLGGLYSGLFTPNEAGAIGVVLGLFITMVIKRSLRPAQLPREVLDYLSPRRRVCYYLQTANAYLCLRKREVEISL